MSRNAEHRLGPFQQQCIDRLEAALHEVGRELQVLEWQPDSPEVSDLPDREFLHARVAGTALEVWIYDNQAEVRVGNVTRPFERPDFRSSDEHQKAFVGAVLERLRDSILDAENEKGEHRLRVINSLMGKGTDAPDSAGRRPKKWGLSFLEWLGAQIGHLLGKLLG